MSHACCGHGKVDRAYAVLGGEPNQRATTIVNKLILKGERAHRLFALIREARENPSPIDIRLEEADAPSFQ